MLNQRKPRAFIPTKITRYTVCWRMMVVFSQAVYQRIIKLSYVDKLLDQVSLEFRDRYKNEVSSGPFRKVNFDNTFKARLFYSSTVVDT